jgi:S-adenosylmethionine synthetase (AdoMet synthetase)/Transposase IS200 like
MQWLEGISSRVLLQEFPALRKKFWGRHFWARGYLPVSSEAITDERLTQRPVSSEVNTVDDEAEGSVYLTVTGCFAEQGNDGEAGRVNNGLITPFRPMTIESAAGKNPVTHAGKLYNIASSLIAADIVREIPVGGRVISSARSAVRFASPRSLMWPCGKPSRGR